MKVLKCNSYQDVSLEASKVVINLMKNKPNCILGLATGSSPIGLYQNLIKAYNDKIIDFENVKTFNLDEYCDIDRMHSQSYYTFMHENLFSKVNINESNVHIPYAKKGEEEICCKQYSDALNNTEIDLQVLGIGANGHIGFNEPGTPFDQETFIVELTQKTREDNKRFFKSIDEVPTHAITMGIKNILHAKQILLIATGKAKAAAVKQLIEGRITTNFPASILQLHPDVIVIIDEEAASLLNN